MIKKTGCWGRFNLDATSWFKTCASSRSWSSGKSPNQPGTGRRLLVPAQLSDVLGPLLGSNSIKDLLQWPRGVASDGVLLQYTLSPDQQRALMSEKTRSGLNFGSETVSAFTR